MSLQPYSGTLETRFLAWSTLLPEERKRRVALALQGLDFEGLWSLTEAHLALYSGEGVALSRHTLRAYRKALEQFLEYARRRGLNLFRLGPEQGLAWVRHLEATANDGRPYAPKSVQVKLAALREFYRALRWAEVTSAHPFEDVKPRRDKTAPWDKRKPYPQDAIQALLEQAGLEDQVLLLLGAHGALRIAEVVGLRWPQVDWGERELLVRGKGGKLRRVRMSRSLNQKLREYRAQLEARSGYDPQAPLFGISDVALRARLKRLCQRAGVDYKGFHAFRHAAGVRLKQAGLDLESIARHHGHSNIETTRIYAKWSDEALEAVLEEL